ncbi:MAG: hypothetical protein IPM56_01285 [Ignavibacteriales bacterium]|nr:MAG: hypothetical protein IPM56_01285 [Ignavibacteriales bacterium]
MKILIFIISFFLFNNLIYSQSDSLQSGSQNMNNDQSSDFAENNKPVSVAGAISLSLMVPGAGLFLSENYGEGAAYFGVSFAFYTTALVFLLSGESPSENVALPFFLVGGSIHLGSIVHTIVATKEYNESILPYVSYNGKNYQVGLSFRF